MCLLSAGTRVVCKASRTEVVSMSPVDSFSPPTDADTRSGLSWPRVLYVDDDPNIVASMERHFHRYRVSLVCAYHGMQGIWLAATERPHLIITDLSMPLATGDELIDCLAAHPATRGTPIIILTGNHGTRMTAHLRQNGVVEVFHKPLKSEELLATVGRFVPLVDRTAA